ncbi:MAG: sugar phosphate isomerase/epimerase [Pedosphaera sp.]|nr:sugar phosphate isomerase/epimerase [Pedosphaera sp.]
MQRFIPTGSIVFFVFCLSLFNASGADGAGQQAGIGKSFKGPIGLQLYSLRFQFSNSVPGTLDKVHKFGIKNVELAGTYGMPIGKFKSELASRKLKAVSAHFSYDRYKKEPEAVAREAKELGLQYAGCAWIPHEGTFDEQECREAIAVFNNAGEILAKQGVRFFYHTHGYEFEPHGNGTLFDLLMAETKPDFVRYEIDVFWILHPGQDPVKLMEKYGKRFELMHVKDMRKGLKGDLTGKSDVDNDVTLGTGQMNWPAILKTGKSIGVKWYFIEDESHFSERQIPQSLKFLEAVQF